jgi:hypothetical protein
MAIFTLDPRDVRLTLNGFPLYGTDSYECEWHVTFQNVSGLFDGVGSTLQTKDKAWSDGWFSNIPVAQGRSIAIEGHIIGSCTENCINAWDAFKRSFNITGQSLVIKLGSISRQVQVMQSSSAPLVEWAGVNILKFSIGLTALDSYLYDTQSVSGNTGLPRSQGGMTFPYHFEDIDTGKGSMWVWSEATVSGSVRLTNTGSAPSPVTIRVDGPVVNPQIEHRPSGHIMAFDLSLGEGHYILINGATHEILIDGTDPAHGSVTRREWSYAEVGENIWMFNAEEPSDNARMTVTFNPAYI